MYILEERKKRINLTDKQQNVLLNFFYNCAFPDVIQRQMLAKNLKMTPRSVQVWFQNQRQKLKQAISKPYRTDVSYVFYNNKLHNPIYSQKLSIKNLRLLADVAFNEYKKRRNNID